MKKNPIYVKLTVAGTASLALMMGCASGGGGNNALSTVDSGLSSIEQSAQAGRQAIASGAAAASGMTNMANSAATGQIGLVGILTQQLGISPQQALGGAGAIFQAAQTGMNPQAFSTLSQSVPGINEMLSAAPTVPNPLGSMGSGVSTMLGGAGNTLNSAASLAASFQQLNLSPEMVGQFIPIVTNYVQNTSGQVTANLLRSALGAP
ncbi:Protein of unknown function VcgC/VcgE [Nitrosomonas aestuarii]|uniref:DUF2780 domain-containing protein n=1 Tax=Nitrosomonas aestuarii TaxID=52441 RepID=A0A1I3XAW8_9PROT|nr:DUF2780 domain-containing protein [Nitrosomonas aestuarii]SFK16723.1 Protein of unknown function VcgC/VcgE [Nitrosomonas aestuarii]